VVYERELATLAAVVLQVRQLYDTVTLNQAAVASKKAVLDRNKFDYERRLEVVDTGAVSVEDFVHAKDDYFASLSDLEQAESALKVAIDAAGNTALDVHPLIEQQKANVRAAYYDLMHCTIYSPLTGYVAQRAVDVGEWATPPTVLMNVIPTDHVWVDANFKETQLTYMRVGQPATVTFDIYGSRVVYEGKVLGIASGTGSVFSLIPPQNATGNWIKIVQRLPVRISLDPEMVKKFPTRLGISAEVDVDISDQSLPMLVQVPSRMPVDVTTVFDIHLEVVNKKIDEVIKSAL
jgi:membrane fusion protein (multidrug efflux system)